MGSTSEVPLRRNGVLPSETAYLDIKVEEGGRDAADDGAESGQDTLEVGANEVNSRELQEVPEADSFPNSLEDSLGANADLDAVETTGVDAEVAESFIASKRIGDRIKHLRQRKQMGLVELGRYTGLSASFLSQLETGRVVPTLRNLARLAMVFSKDLSYFFEPERPELFRILRAEERTRHPQTGAEEPGYFFESLGHVPIDHAITPYFAEFLPGNGRRTPRSHQHPGAEFLYMLTGQLHITHNGESTSMEEGDAVYFNSSATHSYERVGEEDCTALILTMPEPLRGVHTGARIPSVTPSKQTASAPRPPV